MINIIPTPKKITEKEGYIDIKGISVCIHEDTDERIKKAAFVLAKEMNKKTGEYVKLTCAVPVAMGGADGTCSVDKAVIFKIGDDKVDISELENIFDVFEKGTSVKCEEYKRSEAYTIDINEKFITVKAESEAGAFYGIQSLRQMVAQFGDKLPLCTIEDEPCFESRGFYQDITRGRVNTLDKLKCIADMLSYYKINSLQLYIEDCFMFKEFEGIITEDEALTAEEILEFDEYCFDRFIELIPSLSTFGHLFTLLQSDRFNYICELENHKLTTHYWMEKQWHHTIDAYNPDSIKVIGSMLEQYIPLFRSDKFNICCDETMDLCNGRNAGKDKGEAYFHHVLKLIDIVKSHGKQVMMWGDVIMAHPELMKEKVGHDVTVLSWCYRDEVAEWLGRFFYDLGYDTIICPGTCSWSRFIENPDASVGNITSFVKWGKKYDAKGVLNTNWGDFGHICSFNCNLYGMLVGAAQSWNPASPIDGEFQKNASVSLYGVKEYNIVETVYNLSHAEQTADWFRFVMWYSKNVIEGKQSELKYDEEGNLTSADAIKSIEICKTEIERLRSLNRSDAVITDLILAAEGILNMNRLMLYINGVEGYKDGEALQKDIDRWLEGYKEAWLRGDKPSQLWRICDFLDDITNKVK